MVKYHMKRDQSGPAPCRADVGTCPLSEFGHYDTPFEVMENYVSLMNDVYGGMPELTKTEKGLQSRIKENHHSTFIFASDEYAFPPKPGFLSFAKREEWREQVDEINRKRIDWVRNLTSDDTRVIANSAFGKTISKNNIYHHLKTISQGIDYVKDTEALTLFKVLNYHGNREPKNPNRLDDAKDFDESYRVIETLSHNVKERSLQNLNSEKHASRRIKTEADLAGILPPESRATRTRRALQYEAKKRKSESAQKIHRQVYATLQKTKELNTRGDLNMDEKSDVQLIQNDLLPEISKNLTTVYRTGTKNQVSEAEEISTKNLKSINNHLNKIARKYSKSNQAITNLKIQEKFTEDKFLKQKSILDLD